MPRPTMDVNGTEYQEILKQRALYRLYKSGYPDVKWVFGVMERLEKKLPYGDYTNGDYADFKKAQEIFDRITIKYGSETGKEQEEHPTTHYIWRTRQDGKVRPEHAVNNGKVFAWDNPPPTGNPGDALGNIIIHQAVGTYKWKGRTVYGKRYGLSDFEVYYFVCDYGADCLKNQNYGYSDFSEILKQRNLPGFKEITSFQIYNNGYFH